MNKSSDMNHQPVSRRWFLGRGMSGASWVLAGGALAPRLEGASSRENPFSYNVDRYRKVDPKWMHYEAAGRFASPRPDPRRMAIDRDGRLYIAAGRSVVVLDRQGTPLAEILGDAPTRCIAVAGDGSRYVGFQDHVEVYDAKGQRTATWDAVVGRPFLTGLAVGENDLFAADAGNRLVWRYDRSGKIQGRIGERDRDRTIPGLVVPSPCLDVEIAPDGLLRVNNPGRHRVEIYTVDGDLEMFWGRASVAIDGFCGCCNPVNLDLLPDGRCVTFEKGLPRVKVYSADGELESVVAAPDQFTDVGKEFSGAALDSPSIGFLDGVIDSEGRIYVLDLLSARVDVFQRKGEKADSEGTPPRS